MGVRVRFDEKAAQYFIYVNHQGKRKAYGAGNDLRKAEKAAKEMRDELQRGNMALPAAKGSVPTLEKFAAEWVVDIETRCKTTTIANYKREFENHINPRLGTRPIDSLTQEDVLDLIKHWARTGLRTGSLQLILAALRAALTDAVAYLPTNPALRLRKKCRQPNEVKMEVHPYTREETAKLLAASLALGADVHPVFLISLRAGLRIGEVLALAWRDIDIPNHRIGVHRSTNQDGVTTSPKRGLRYVDLNDEIAAYLKTMARPDDPKTLVCRHGGHAYTQAQVYWLFRRVRKAAELRHIRIHDMRHTFASQLLEAGVPIHYVSKQIGHHSIQLTVDLYGHLVPGANRDWMNRLSTGVC